MTFKVSFTKFSLSFQKILEHRRGHTHTLMSWYHQITFASKGKYVDGKSKRQFTVQGRRASIFAPPLFNPIHIFTSYSYKINFNIPFNSAPTSTKCYIHLTFLEQNLAYISHFFQKRYETHPLHSPRLRNSRKITWTSQIMRLFLRSKDSKRGLGTAKFSTSCLFWVLGYFQLKLNADMLIMWNHYIYTSVKGTYIGYASATCVKRSYLS
jgi:hypothetical protein